MPIRTARYREGRFTMIITTFESSDDPRAVRRRAYVSLLFAAAAVGGFVYAVYSLATTGQLTVPWLLALLWFYLVYARELLPHVRGNFRTIMGRPALATDDETAAPLEPARARRLPPIVLVLASVGIAIFVVEVVTQIVHGELSFTTPMVLILLGLSFLFGPYIPFPGLAAMPGDADLQQEAQDPADTPSHPTEP